MLAAMHGMQARQGTGGLDFCVNGWAAGLVLTQVTRGASLQEVAGLLKCLGLSTSSSPAGDGYIKSNTRSLNGSRTHLPGMQSSDPQSTVPSRLKQGSANQGLPTGYENKAPQGPRGTPDPRRGC